MDERSNTKRNAARGHARYDRDLYGWATEQAALLRAGRMAEADAANIAGELDDVGSEQYDKLESALRMILLHLLKWQCQPSRRGKSWRASVANNRDLLEVHLADNPGLKSFMPTALTQAYRLARRDAEVETDLDQSTFPQPCPWTYDEIMNPDFCDRIVGNIADPHVGAIKSDRPGLAGHGNGMNDSAVAVSTNGHHSRRVRDPHVVTIRGQPYGIAAGKSLRLLDIVGAESYDGGAADRYPNVLPVESHATQLHRTSDGKGIKQSTVAGAQFQCAGGIAGKVLQPNILPVEQKRTETRKFQGAEI